MSSQPMLSPCVQFRTEQLNLSTGTPLGSGAISHVVQCRLSCAACPHLPIVVKIVSKLQLLQQGKVQNVMNEKQALQRLGPHPYIARLYGTAQSEDELYYVLEWLPHGDLLQLIRRAALERVREYNAESLARVAASLATGGSLTGSFTGSFVGSDGHASEVAADLTAAVPSVASNVTAAASAAGRPVRVTSIPHSSTALRCLDFSDIQLITAQLIVALSHVAAKGLVLRDFKPENIAFDEKYRACLLDFDTVDLEGAVNSPETNNGVACKLLSSVSPAAAASEAEGDDEGAQDVPPHQGHRAEGSQPQPSSTASAPSSATPPAGRRRLTVSEIQSMRKKSASFCGTAQYVSPEMVGECKWSFSSDLWALGALVYEMAYGTHLFAGLTQFEVLQKVIQGGYTGKESLFPRVDFGCTAVGTAEDANEEGEEEAYQDNFTALKDFILQLLNIDPSKRLGVSRQTRRFDEAALRRHPLFRGFAWERIEGQLRTFCARSLKAANNGTSAAAAGPAASSEERKDAGNDAAAALEALAAASVDPSPSLGPLYHVKPFNDPSYAEYVFRATADANPFERFFTNAGCEGVDDSSVEEAGLSAGVAPERNASPAGLSESRAPAANEEASAHSAAEAVPAKPDANAAEEEDDVIDDAGMSYAGHHAHTDFQE